MTSTVRIERRELAGGVPDAGIALLTLDNPPLNLVTAALLDDLRSALTTVEADAALRAVVVHQGDARAFCAGSDMREFEATRAAAAERKILLENHVLRQLAHLPYPTIAAIEGTALGGGLELALACDLRVAGASSRLGLPEAQVGGLASNGSQRLTKLVGPARAKQMLFTGEALSAATALDWGLVNEVVPDGSALDAATGLATRLGALAPLSIRLSKRLVDLAVDAPLDAGITAAIEAQEQVFRTHDLLEGAAAFQEKRPPRFAGR